jgi:HEAT repeat protein
VTTELLLDDLRRELARGRVIILVGAGVSVGATEGVPVASWQGLLEDGVARCEQLALRPVPAGWGDWTRQQIRSGDVGDMILAAEAVTDRLGDREHGEYRRWLRERVGELRAGHPEVLQALGDLPGILATTNYDGLLEQVTGLPAVTWQDHARTQAVLRGDDEAILHLHGFWQQPESVVLGVRSYEQLLGDEHAQAMQHAMATVGTLLLVGFGLGLTDPNFEALRAWMGRLFKGGESRHFRLAKDGEVKAVRAQHSQDERVFVLGYGAAHADLPAYLRRLGPTPPSAVATGLPGDTRPLLMPQQDLSIKTDSGGVLTVDPARMEGEYLEVLLGASDLANMPVPPLGSVPLERLYVPPLVAPDGAWSSASAGRPPGTIPALQAVAQLQRMVILAGAGSGKTTFLRFLARELAAGRLPGTLPLLVSLNAYAMQRDRTDLISFALQDRLSKFYKGTWLEVLDQLLRTWNREGKLLFLLDALDEVPEDQRYRILDEITALKRFVLTSRPTIRVEANQEREATMQLLPLDPAGVAKFVRNWAAAALSDDRFSPDRLLGYLRAEPQLADLATVPQLLGLICWLWGNQEVESSQTRVQLLARAIDALVAKAVERTHSTPEEAEVLPQHFLQWLRRLALDMCQAEEGVQVQVSAEELLNRPEPTQGALQAGQLLRLARWSGLLIPTPSRAHDYQFLHFVFQEFLAAEALVRADDFGAMVDSVKRRAAFADILRMASALLSDRGAESKLRMLLDRLLSDDDIFRMNWRLAALCLSEVADPERRLGPVVARVAEVLLECASEWWARESFTEAIGELRTESMRTLLVAELRNDDQFVRWAAARSLARMADPQALDALLSRLPDEPWDPVRAALMEGLGRIGDRSAVPMILEIADNADEDSQLLSAAGEALGRMDAVDGLLRLLERDEATGSRAVSSALPFIPEASAKRLQTELAARGISVSFTPDDPYVLAGPSQEELDAWLASPDPEDRKKAVTTLGWIGDEPSIRQLAQLLLDEDEGVWQAAARTLSEMADDAEALLWFLTGEIQYLRVGEERRDVEIAARVLLRLWLSPPARQAILDAPEVVEQAILQAGGEALIARLSDQDEIVRGTTAWLLGLLPGTATMDLVAALEDDGVLVRWSAAWALGWRQEREAVPKLLERLDEEDSWEVREACIRALGAITDPQAVHPLLGLLVDQPAEVRAAAASALGALGAVEALQPLIKQLDDEESEIRAAAAEALGALRNESAVPLLAACLARDVDVAVRVAAANALGHIGTPDCEAALLQTLDEPDPGLRETVIRNLGVVGSAAAGSRLSELVMADPEQNNRDEAAQAVSRIANLDIILSMAARLTAEGSLSRLTTLAVGLMLRADRDLIDRFVEHLEREGIVVRIGRFIVELRHRGDIYRHILKAEMIEVTDPDQSPVTYFTQALQREAPIERWEAVWALAELTGEESVAALATALLDQSTVVAQAAAEALDTLSQERSVDVAPAIVEVLQRSVRDGMLPQLLDNLLSAEGAAEVSTYSVLSQVELLCPLMSAYRTGDLRVRPVLWNIAERYGALLLSNGRVVLPSGQEVDCEDAVIRLPSST